MTKPTSLTEALPQADELLNVLFQAIYPLLKADTALVGIQSGGVWMMENLLPKFSPAIEKYHIEHGMLDVSMHRDDYAKRGLKNKMQPSQIRFDVQNKHIILIDDIFYTGRTTRAAMNELFDYGRPASITLAVLINRGGRELPIQPDIAAHSMQLTPAQRLQLSRNVDGSLHIALESQKN
jgi:pyrimidine operon attenuation protein/uracil phosphoribosyltransferase